MLIKRVIRSFCHLAAIFLSFLTLSHPALADDCKEARTQERGPSNKKLVALELALGAVDYVLGVTLHEGAHAIAVKSLGGKVEEFSIFPSISKKGTFRFGYVKWNSGRPCKISWSDENGQVHEGMTSCSFTPGEKAPIYIAPKIIDGMILGGFTLAFERGWA